MGDLISLSRERAARARPERRQSRGRVTFFFDLTSPFTYLAAERVDRLFGQVDWRPALSDAVPADMDAERAEHRAEMLRMPLVWPETFPAAGRAAMRVASLAADEGRGAPFALAACRLAFCGGFDLDDPEVLAEAAAAAGLGLDGCLAAAGDRERDAELDRVGRGLAEHGAACMPAIRVGRALFCGEDRLAEAAAAAREGRFERRSG
jgi:2-hydroxychromene-2-carboxylate isomerase